MPAKNPRINIAIDFFFKNQWDEQSDFFSLKQISL